MPKTRNSRSRSTRRRAAAASLPDVSYDLIAQHLAGRNSSRLQTVGSTAADVARLVQTSPTAREALERAPQARPCHLMLRDGRAAFSDVLTARPSIVPATQMVLTACAPTKHKRAETYLGHLATEAYAVLGMFASLKLKSANCVELLLTRPGDPEKLVVSRKTAFGTGGDNRDLRSVDWLYFEHGEHTVGLIQNRDDIFAIEVQEEDAGHIEALLSSFIPEDRWTDAVLRIDPYGFIDDGAALVFADSHDTSAYDVAVALKGVK